MMLMIHRGRWGFLFLFALTVSVLTANGLTVSPCVASEQAGASSSAAIAKGRVYHDKNSNRQFDAGDVPLEGIRVSNGVEIVVTGAAGEYELPVTEDTILFVLKPRGWKSPLSPENLPQFFYIHKPQGSPEAQFAGVKPTGDLPASIDFPLSPQEEPNQYQVILFGDTQPRNQQEVDWITHDVIEELIGTTAAFGITLGDVSFDDLNTLEPLNKAIALIDIPWFNVMGNHDVNYDAPRRELANETFESIYGPGYYSFDYGPVHYVVLDDIETIHQPDKKRSTYRGGFGKQQLKFLENDLKHVPEDQLVVLLMHIPLTFAHDRHELYRLIEDREHCISFSAHTHHHEHILIDEKDGWRGAKPHHHMNHVTVCGSWWSGTLDERGIPHATMGDGAPNGYSFLNIDGTRYTLDYKAAGREKDYQMEIDAPEVVSASAAEQPFVYVNFFNGSATSVVKMQVADGKWLTMEKSREEDPKYRRMHTREVELLEGKKPAPFRKPAAVKACSHLWKLPLPAGLPTGTHAIKVLATDHWGRDFEAVRILRIEP